MSLKVNPRFRDALIRLTSDEFEQLERNIIEYGGVRDPIVVWDGWIVDGHNRYNIATQHGYDYEVDEMFFEDEDAALDWILRNQLGRRNLDPMKASIVRGMLVRERQNPKAGRPKKCPQNDAISTGRAVESVAKDTGVSKATAERDAKLADAMQKMDNDVAIDLLNGDVKATKKARIALAELPESKQVAAVKKVKDGKAKTIDEALNLTPKKTPKTAKAKRTQPRQKMPSTADLMRMIQDVENAFAKLGRGDAAAEFIEGLRDLA